MKHVSSPCQLWVCLLEHLPLERGESPVCPPHSSDATQLSLDLALTLGVPEARVSLPDAVEGMVCALIEGDGCCCRVRVMQFSEPLDLYFHHKEQARVWFEVTEPDWRCCATQ